MFRSLVGHFFKTSRPTVDNFVFRLHYRITVWLLLVCTAALLWKINYGNPINCLAGDYVLPSYGNDHCWYEGTITSVTARNLTVGKDVPAPGISHIKPGDQIEYHNIHRWVIICVLVQAVFFYIPRIIWKTLEGGLMRRWTWNLSNPRTSNKQVQLKVQEIRSFIFGRSQAGLLYAGGLLLCELANLVNVFIQALMVSHILQTPLVSLNLLILSRSQRFDLSRVSSFPLQTKCTVRKFGASGVVVRYDMQCLMTINGVMEAIFVYQWIWFTLLAIISVLAVLYRVVTLIIPQFRVWKLQAKTGHLMDDYVDRASKHLGLGQWFLVYVLSKNVDPIFIKKVLCHENTNSDLPLHEEIPIETYETHTYLHDHFHQESVVP